jgi:hypothetical protein
MMPLDAQRGSAGRVELLGFIEEENMKTLSGRGASVSIVARALIVIGLVLVVLMGMQVTQAAPRFSFGRSGDAPPAINDLTATTGTELGEVDLSWTVPTGAASYEVRYNTEAITAANWDASTVAPDPPLPGAAFSTEIMTVNGLAPGPDYYFAVVSKDGGGDPSPISNSPSAAAPKYWLYLAVMPKRVESRLISKEGVESTHPQGAFTYTSGFQVQNLEANDASITVTFYNQDGSTGAKVNDTISGNATNTYSPNPFVTDGFNGSVVISSDRAIAAIGNIKGESETGSGFASYEAASSGNTRLGLPLLMKNNYGYNTWFNVQNVGSKDADITVTYTDETGAAIGSDSASVKPGAAHTFDQYGATHEKSLFGAVVTSDQPIASTVIDDNGSSSLGAYTAYSPGKDELVMPLANNNAYGYQTAIQVMNVSSSNAASVIVSYGDNGTGGSTPRYEDYIIPPGGWQTIPQYGQTLENDWDKIGPYVGSAALYAAGGSGSLIAVVNQTGPNNQRSHYTAADPSGGSNNVTLPNIMSSPQGYYTSIGVVNLSTYGDQYPVWVNYSSNQYEPSQVPNPDLTTFNYPLASRYLTQQGSPGVSSGVNDWKTMGSYLGSARVQGTGGEPVIAVVNQIHTGGLYDSAAYTGFNNTGAFYHEVNPAAKEASPQGGAYRMAGPQTPEVDTITFYFTYFNFTPFRISGLSLGGNSATYSLDTDSVEPDTVIFGQGTFTVGLETAAGPLENQTVLSGFYSNGELFSHTVQTRIGLPRLYGVDPGSAAELDFIGGTVSAQVPLGAIPFGGAYLKYTAYGREPFETGADGLPHGSGNFVQAFGLALMGETQEVIETAVFTPALSLTVTYSQTIIDRYIFNEEGLTVVYYVDELNQWQTITPTLNSTDTNQITFPVKELHWTTQFGIVDGQKQPFPIQEPQEQEPVKLFLPLVVR